MFTDEQLERYARHIVIKEVGQKGQQKLLDSKVLVIGAGGLGSPALMYLSASGVGNIGIVDSDCVDLSNLQRQIIHHDSDIGIPKVISAKNTINAMNPDIKVKTYYMKADESNIMDLIKDYDYILDCTDNFNSKFMINDACVMSGKPFTHAGILRFEGQLMTYIPEKNSPCYRCVFGNPPPPDAVPTVKQVGVIGAVCGTTGTLQALEAIKYIIGTGELLSGYLLNFNALTMNFRKIKLPNRSESCPVCSHHKKKRSIFQCSFFRGIYFFVPWQMPEFGQP